MEDVEIVQQCYLQALSQYILPFKLLQTKKRIICDAIHIYYYTKKAQLKSLLSSRSNSS